MSSSATKRGLLVGLISGAIAGALFGLFIHALDSDLGKDFARAVGLATKDRNSSASPLTAESRAGAAFLAGFLLALLAAWVIRKAVTIKTTRPLPVQMDQGLLKDWAWKLGEALLLAILAGLCGVLTAGPVALGPPIQVVLLVAAATAIGGGLYGALVGWLEYRRLLRWVGR